MSDRASETHTWAAVAFAVGLTVLVAIGLYLALGFGAQARRFPIIVAIPTVGLGVLQIAREIRAATGRRHALDDVASPEQQAGEPQQTVAATVESGVTSTPATDAVGAGGDPRTAASESAATAAEAFGWLSLMVVIFLMFGLLVAIPLFLAAFMHWYGRESLRSTILAILAVMAGIYGFFVMLLGIRLFEGPVLRWMLQMVSG